MTVLERWQWQPSRVVTRQASRVVLNWSTDVSEEHDAGWTVRDPWTGIFGSGDDNDAAYADFLRALAEHFDVLSRQEALSPELAAQLEYLRRRLS